MDAPAGKPRVATSDIAGVVVDLELLCSPPSLVNSSHVGPARGQETVECSDVSGQVTTGPRRDLVLFCKLGAELDHTDSLALVAFHRQENRFHIRSGGNSGRRGLRYAEHGRNNRDFLVFQNLASTRDQ